MGECTRKCKRIEAMPTSSSTLKRMTLGFKEFERSSHYCPCRLLDSPQKSDSRASVEYSGGQVDDDNFSWRSGSDHIPGSCCSGNDPSQFVGDRSRSVDLEAKSFKTENNYKRVCNKFSRETTPSSELCEDTDQIMEKPAATEQHAAPARKSPWKAPEAESDDFFSRKITPEELQAEIDEFFSEYKEEQKREVKRLSEKYNFDFEKGVPLEGRYKWIRLKP